MVVHGIPRYACWPWYGCNCPVGKLVSESVMRRHMKRANELRASIGRGPFTPGPKVTDSSVTEYHFPLIDSLENHDTDDESGTIAPMNSGLSTGENVRFAAGSNLVDYHESYTNPGQIPDSIQGPQSTTSELMTEAYSYFGTDVNEEMNEANEILPAISEHNDVSAALMMDQFSSDVGETDQMQVQEDSPPPDDDQLMPNTELDRNVNATAGSVLVDQNDGIDHETDLDMTELLQGDEEPGSALLEDEDLDSSQVPQLLSWVVENRKWVDMYVKHGLECTVMDDVIKNAEAPCKTWKTVMGFISRSSAIEEHVQSYHHCPGHMCFSEVMGSSETTHCSHCGKEKPSLESPQSEKVTYLPILPRIASIVRDEQGYNALYGYRHHYERENGLVRDYFDSEAFQRLCEEHGGEENLKYDIFLSLSTDGFQAHKNRNYDVWPIVAVLFNLPPEQRTCVRNIFPFMFVTGGKEPKDLQSYLLPFVNELLGICENGGTMLKFFDGVERKVRIHLIHFTGDSPAVSKVASLKGHHGMSHCSFCMVLGVYVPQCKGYYFPSQYTTESGELILMYSAEDLPIRTEASVLEALFRLENATTASEREKISKETGIKGPTVLCLLPTMRPYKSFPIDTMHLFYNIQVRLLELFTSSSDEEFSFDAGILFRLDDELTSWGKHISGQLCSCPKPLAHFRKWKAAEHRQFTLMYSLILFDGYLSQEYLDGLQCFVKLVEICTQTCVTNEQTVECGKHAVYFFQHYEQKFMRHEWGRLYLAKSVIHQVLHLEECLREFGPLPYCAQNWVEGYIGWVVDRNNARHRAAESMTRSAFFRESYKAFFSEPFKYSAEHYDTLSDDKDIEFSGSLGNAWITEEVDQGKQFRMLISSYFRRKYDLTISAAKLLAENLGSFQFVLACAFLLW